MSETKFTPGPWRSTRSKVPVDDEYDYGIVANFNGSEKCIAETFGRCSNFLRIDASANAAIIAAAPDLYAALERLCAVTAGWDVEDEVNAGLAALAKARGEQ